MNLKTKKHLIKSMAMIFSVGTFFMAANSYTSHAAAPDSNSNQEILSEVIVSQEDLDTGLMAAAISGDLNECRDLIQLGANVNFANDDGCTPLHLAAGAGHIDICVLLLDHNAAVDATDESGSTPLHLAALPGHESICSLLIERGANVNAEDNNHSTPLWIARLFGRQNVQKLLLRHGATGDKFQGLTFNGSVKINF